MKIPGVRTLVAAAAVIIAATACSSGTTTSGSTVPLVPSSAVKFVQAGNSMFRASFPELPGVSGLNAYNACESGCPYGLTRAYGLRVRLYESVDSTSNYCAISLYQMAGRDECEVQPDLFEVDVLPIPAGQDSPLRTAEHYLGCFMLRAYMVSGVEGQFCYSEGGNFAPLMVVSDNLLYLIYANGPNSPDHIYTPFASRFLKTITI